MRGKEPEQREENWRIREIPADLTCSEQLLFRATSVQRVIGLSLGGAASNLKCVSYSG